MWIYTCSHLTPFSLHVYELVNILAGSDVQSCYHILYLVHNILCVANEVHYVLTFYILYVVYYLLVQMVCDILCTLLSNN